MSFTFITVTGRYIDADEQPLAGTVEFRLTTAMQNSVSDEIIPRSKLQATLDESGEFALDLAATDDTGTSPLGAVYQVTERIRGARTRTYKIAVHHDAAGGTLDLADAAPVTDVVYQEYALVGHTHPDLGGGGGGGGTPSGGAGGVLSGTYPNPGFAVDMATQAELDSHKNATTTAHGIANTALLETQTGAQTKADAAQAAAAAASIPLVQKGAVSGVAPLGSDGKIASSYLPPIAINDTFVVGSQAAMLALPAQRGDVAVRTDFTPAHTFILSTDSPGTLAEWVEITAAGSVVSVNGQTGAVSIPADPAPGTVGLRTLGTGGSQAAAGNDSRFTDQRVPVDGSVTPAKFGTVPVDTLSDVDTGTSAPATGDSFAWTGTLWVPRKRVFSGTLANRAVVVPAPVEGDQYDATDDDGGTRWVYRGGAWVQVGAGVLETGGRQLAVTEVATAFASVSAHNALQDVTGRTVTFAAGNRPVEIVFFDPWTTGTAIGNVQVQLVRTDTGLPIQQALLFIPTATGIGYPVSMRRTLTGLTPGQNYTVKVVAKANVNNAWAMNNLAVGTSILEAIER